MKILFLFGNHNKVDALKSLARRGHAVSFFNSGHYDLSRRPYLRWGEKDRIPGVDLVNSPNMHWTSGDPETQTEHPVVEQLTAQVLDRVQPDLVVAEDLSGHTLSVLELLQSRGVPTTVTMHNYWLLCPQNNLLDAGGQRCEDFEGGARCCRCRWLPRPEARFRVALFKAALRDTPLFPPVRRLRQIWRQVLAPKNTPAPGPPGWGPPLYAASAFARRRQRAVAALNRVEEVHALSSRSAAVLTRHGISAEKIKVVPFLASHFQRLAPASRAPSSRLTFGYRGDLSFTKGLHVLIEAFGRLDQKRARLLIYGSGEPEYLLPLRRLARGLNVDFRSTYVPQDLPRINQQIDVGVVPSLCEETLCLTGLEFLYSGVPLIASRLGGMVDYVEEGVNGFLVAPGDPEALAQAMSRFLEDSSLLTRLSSNCRPQYSMDQVTDTWRGVTGKSSPGVSAMKLNHNNPIPAATLAGKDQEVPELSVCIVAHNHREDLDQALGSVYAFASSFNPEVIVVDNNSTDGTAAMVAEKYPRVRLIRNTINQGYAPGMNLALAQSRGEFILTLSHDAELKPGAVQNMIKFLRLHPKAGLVGPRTLDRQGEIVATLHHPNLLLHVWLGIIPVRSWVRRHNSLRRLLTKTFPNTSGLTSDYDSTHRVAVADGGCLMTRRLVLEKVGPLDPAIPFGPDDYDWCFRVSQAGFEIWYVAEGEIIHKTSVKDDMGNLFPGYLRLKFPQLCYLYGKSHRGFRLYFFYFSAYLGNLLLQKSARKIFGPQSKQLLALQEASALILQPSRYLRRG